MLSHGPSSSNESISPRNFYVYFLIFLIFSSCGRGFQVSQNQDPCNYKAIEDFFSKVEDDDQTRGEIRDALRDTKTQRRGIIARAVGTHARDRGISLEPLPASGFGRPGQQWQHLISLANSLGYSDTSIDDLYYVLITNPQALLEDIRCDDWNNYQRSDRDGSALDQELDERYENDNQENIKILKSLFYPVLCMIENDHIHQYASEKKSDAIKLFSSFCSSYVGRGYDGIIIHQDRYEAIFAMYSKLSTLKKSGKATDVQRDALDSIEETMTETLEGYMNDLLCKQEVGEQITPSQKDSLIVTAELLYTNTTELESIIPIIRDLTLYNNSVREYSNAVYERENYPEYGLQYLPVFPILPSSIALVREYTNTPETENITDAEFANNLLTDLYRVWFGAIVACDRGVPIPGMAEEEGLDRALLEDLKDIGGVERIVLGSIQAGSLIDEVTLNGLSQCDQDVRISFFTGPINNRNFVSIPGSMDAVTGTYDDTQLSLDRINQKALTFFNTNPGISGAVVVVGGKSITTTF